MNSQLIISYLLIVGLFSSFKNKSKKDSIILEGINKYTYYSHGENLPSITEGKFNLIKNNHSIKSIKIQEVYSIGNEKNKIENFSIYNSDFKEIKEKDIDSIFYISIESIKINPINKKTYGVEIKMEVQTEKNTFNLTAFSEIRMVRKNSLKK